MLPSKILREWAARAPSPRGGSPRPDHGLGEQRLDAGIGRHQGLELVGRCVERSHIAKSTVALSLFIKDKFEILPTILPR